MASTLLVVVIAVKNPRDSGRVRERKVGFLLLLAQSKRLYVTVQSCCMENLMGSAWSGIVEREAGNVFI